MVVCGKVLDNERNPLGMVSVLVEGTSVGVVTNELGEFQLPPVKGKSVNIIFSSVGYKKGVLEVTLKGHPSVIQILVPEMQKIEEVVVEGRAERTNVVNVQSQLLKGCHPYREVWRH